MYKHISKEQKEREDSVRRERWIRFGKDVGIVSIPRADKLTQESLDLRSKLFK